MNRLKKSLNFIGVIIGYLSLSGIIGFYIVTIVIDYLNKA